MSLKQALKKRVLEDMIATSRSANEYVVLVLDDHTTKIVSSCARMFDVMEAGVLALENLHRAREVLDMPAIYFLEPSEASVKAFCADFAKASKPQYAIVHLWFSSAIDQYLMDLIGASPVVSRIKTFSELNADFVAMESRTFSFARQKAIPRLYFKGPDVQAAELAATSRQIASLCITINEYPYIRWHMKSRQCEYLAKYVEQDLNKMLRNLSKWKPLDDNRERGTLLIVDRSLDPLSPVMHEYTYQAMINDLLPVRGEICNLNGFADEKDDKKAEANRKADIVISEDDPLWTEFRHKHIGEVLGLLTKKFHEFRANNAIVKLKSNDSASVTDMAAAMKDFPQYRELIKKYFNHMSIAEAAMNKYDAQQLAILSELEQDMATGLDAEGRKANAKDITSRLTQFCLDPHVGTLEKLRLLMIYIMSQGGVGKSRKQLLGAAKINAKLEDAIINLKHLGIDLTTPAKKASAKVTKERQQQFQSRIKNIPLQLMRYVPYLHDIMNFLVQETLSKDEFPYIIEPPPKIDTHAYSAPKPSADVSVRRKPNTFRVESKESDSKGDDEKKQANGPRYIVFVLGGMTFSEMRSAYELSIAHDLIIGSTETLAPNDYIRSLSDLPLDADLDAIALDETGTRAGGDSDDEEYNVGVDH